MKFCFVEEVTLLNCFFRVMPLLWRDRPVHIYIFDGSFSSIGLACAMAKLLKQKAEKFLFRLVDVKDEKGLSICLRVGHQDYAEVKSKIIENRFFPLAQNGDFPKNRFFSYFSKDLATQSLYGRHTVSHALLLVQLAAWKAREMKNDSKEPVLFLSRRPWLASIHGYALRHGIKIESLLPSWNLNLKRPWMRPLYHAIKNQIWHLRYRPLRRKRGPDSILGEAVKGPKVIVDCHYHVNLNRPEIFSEFFFLQRSKLSGKDVIATFHVPRDPLNAEKLADLKQYGITALPLRPEATTVAECPPFYPRLERRRKKKWANGNKGLRDQMANYQRLKNYWGALFDRWEGRFYVSWYKYGPEHCAIADAMKETGGVSALYQRAMETNPSPANAVDVDLFFGFSKLSAEVERSSRSIIPYFIVTGYLGDHRFSLLKGRGEEIRNRLMQKGAKRIISYTDENSHDEERWLLGHTITRENHSFLLEKVLSHPWFGLVLKPKIPATLRYRLGPVADLLTKALETGRCVIFEEGECHGSYPPAVAALSADVAIHGHLCAPTAGLEAALAGVSTLLMDREGWGLSPLYQLGVGKVVFEDWASLWEACLDQWNSPKGMPGFGDWSFLLDAWDPFRDGRAAERMGTYMEWLIEGFKAGLNSKTVMADAAERYCKQWGKDKVLAIQ